MQIVTVTEKVLQMAYSIMMLMVPIFVEMSSLEMLLRAGIFFIPLITSHLILMVGLTLPPSELLLF